MRKRLKKSKLSFCMTPAKQEMVGAYGGAGGKLDQIEMHQKQAIPVGLESNKVSTNK